MKENNMENSKNNSQLGKLSTLNSQFSTEKPLSTFNSPLSTEKSLSTLNSQFSTEKTLNSPFSTLNYLGKGWAFPPVFVRQQGVEMAEAEEDIRQSLRILFSTTPGERIFRFDYGCNIRQWVFGEMNLSTKTLIIDTIKQAVLYYEPRIEVEKIEVEIKDPLEGILWINMDYTIHQTNSRSNMVFPFYFKEGTNL